MQDLKDRKELLDLHIKTLAKQEQMLRKQMERYKRLGLIV